MKKQFKTESKKMLDMMIHSVYTNREIFLRELISNASDAIDKRVFGALTNSASGLERSDYAITIVRDEPARTLTIRDNGCGMTREELEINLGTLARSGSGQFKKENEGAENIDIIGQFGVGFYSAFMVSDRITVRSYVYGADTGYLWQSEGVDGYTIEPCDYRQVGSEIELHLREDTENEKYSEFLDSYRIEGLVRKYSDYIRYPIRMSVTRSRLKEGTGTDGKEPEYESVTETETLNSRIPLWHKKPSEIQKEEYNEFYKTHFFDFADPVDVIHSRTEGTVSYEMLLFIPSKAPFDYYSKQYEKGLQLYASGVMIMEKCADLLPDCFNFVRGVVDSSDLTLNISRETLQQNHQVRAIARNLEKKIRERLMKLQEEQREKYEEFFEQFGVQLKYGAYADYGAKKDELQDLLLFRSSPEKKYVTLKEYVSRMPTEQKSIYYATGETPELAEALPRTAAVRAKGYEVLLLTDDIDEFVLRVLQSYAEKNFVNVSTENLDVSSAEEKDALKKENEDSKDLLAFMKDTLGDEVSAVRFSNTVGTHPVNLSSEGELSAEMAKVLNRMPGSGDRAKAQLVLEINMNHPVAEKLRTLYATDRDRTSVYARILYNQARLICGLPVQDPGALADLVVGLM